MIQVVRPHLITMSKGGVGDDDKVDEHVDTHNNSDYDDYESRTGIKETGEFVAVGNVLFLSFIVVMTWIIYTEYPWWIDWRSDWDGGDTFWTGPLVNQGGLSRLFSLPFLVLVMVLVTPAWMRNANPKTIAGKIYFHYEVLLRSRPIRFFRREFTGKKGADLRFAIIAPLAVFACYALINGVYVAMSTPFPSNDGVVWGSSSWLNEDDLFLLKSQWWGDRNVALRNCCCLVPLLVYGVLLIMESAPEGSKTSGIWNYLDPQGWHPGQAGSARGPGFSTGGTSPPGSIMKYSSWNQPFCHSCGRQVLSGMLRTCDACGKQRCINCGGSGHCRDCNRGVYH